MLLLIHIYLLPHLRISSKQRSNTPRHKLQLEQRQSSSSSFPSVKTLHWYAANISLIRLMSSCNFASIAARALAAWSSAARALATSASSASIFRPAAPMYVSASCTVFQMGGTPIRQRSSTSFGHACHITLWILDNYRPHHPMQFAYALLAA